MTSVGSGISRAPSVIIIGAGIGGLATAVGLRQAGWQVTVLEQAPEITEVGAGLSLWPNALIALESLGLAEQVRESGVRTISRGTIRDSTGTYLRRARADDIHVLVVHRAELLETLLTAATSNKGEPVADGPVADRPVADEPVADAVVRVDARVTDVIETAAGVKVRYRSGSDDAELTADLVVAADGINSVVRQGLWPESRPSFRGRTVWRGLLDSEAVKSLGEPLEASMTLGSGEQFGLLPMPGGGCYWFLTADAEAEDRLYGDELGEVRRRLADWHSLVPEVVAGTTPDAVHHSDVVDLDPVPTFVRGRVILLGDAAHAMTPALGQGACQALEDAVALSRLVAAEPDLGAALAGYDRLRRPRVQEMAAASRKASRSHQDRGPIVERLTRLVIPLLPPTVWRKSVARWAEPAG